MSIGKTTLDMRELDQFDWTDTNHPKRTFSKITFLLIKRSFKYPSELNSNKPILLYLISDSSNNIKVQVEFRLILNNVLWLNVNNMYLHQFSLLQQSCNLWAFSVGCPYESSAGQATPTAQQIPQSQRSHLGLIRDSDWGHPEPLSRRCI